MAETIVVKQISPTRFKDEAFTAAIVAAARKASHEIVLDYRETTRSWNHKPVFEVVINVNPNIEILVGTDDEIYGYVDEGTKPHIIKPKRARALSFQWGGKGSYMAKTKPGVIGSQPGGPRGPMVSFKQVHHPGTKARGFSKAIDKKWSAAFKRRMEHAMSAGADASGHSI